MNFILLLIPLLLIFVWMPNAKKKQEAKNKQKLDLFKPGSIIMTYAGVIGEITKIDGNYAILRSGDTELVIIKDAILREVTDNCELLNQSNSKTNLIEENTSNESEIKVEIMQPQKESKREKYGF